MVILALREIEQRLLLHLFGDGAARRSAFCYTLVLHKDGKAAVARLTGMVKRGGMYWLRVRVPADLVSTFKKREIVYSLRTKDRAEAELKASAERLRIQLEFQSHRKGHSRPVVLKNLRNLSVDEIQGLVQHWFHDLETAATRVPAIGSGARDPLEHAEHLIELKEDMATMQAELAGNNQPFDPVWADKPLRDLLSTNGVAKIDSAEGREKLRRLILRGLIEARRRMHERLGGGNAGERDPYFSAIDADAPPPPRKDIKQVKGTTLRELLTQFLREQGPKNLRKKTLSHPRRNLRAPRPPRSDGPIWAYRCEGN